MQQLRNALPRTREKMKHVADKRRKKSSNQISGCDWNNSSAAWGFTRYPSFGKGGDGAKWYQHLAHSLFHTSAYLNTDQELPAPATQSTSACCNSGIKPWRRPKGKRAVTKWLKYFRWKKKWEYKRMNDDEKLLFKLKKAKRKEERLVRALEKIDSADTLSTVHDPEILTPEEHYHFLKKGLKCKNYVPVGRRGIYQGVILNMHLNWKKHELLQVIVKTFTAEEVKEMAAELAQLTGGIVLDIHDEDTIIMYRGKNYYQPPSEIMSPRITLCRKKALDKSKYRDALRAVRKYIPRLEEELKLLVKHGGKDAAPEIHEYEPGSGYSDLESLDDNQPEDSEDDGISPGMSDLDSKELSDVLEVDTDADMTQDTLFLHQFEKFPSVKDETEHVEQLCKLLFEPCGQKNGAANSMDRYHHGLGR